MSNKNNDIKKFDAILVLSNEMNREGELNKESKARAIMAIKIFKKYSAKYLITSGWNYRKDTNLCIATAFKNFILLNSDIKSKYILTELNSRDTVGDAYFTKTNIMIPYNCIKLCVITSNYHIYRTRRIFNFIYGNKYYINFFGVKLIPSFSYLIKEFKSLKSFENTFSKISSGDDNAILETIRKNHPFYNGKIFRRID